MLKYISLFSLFILAGCKTTNFQYEEAREKHIAFIKKYDEARNVNDIKLAVSNYSPSITFFLEECGKKPRSLDGKSYTLLLAMVFRNKDNLYSITRDVLDVRFVDDLVITDSLIEERISIHDKNHSKKFKDTTILKTVNGEYKIDWISRKETCKES